MYKVQLRSEHSTLWPQHTEKDRTRCRTLEGRIEAGENHENSRGTMCQFKSSSGGSLRERLQEIFIKSAWEGSRKHKGSLVSDTVLLPGKEEVGKEGRSRGSRLNASLREAWPGCGHS